MLGEKLIGHVTIRVPVYEVRDQESWEIPEEYTYLAPGDAELVTHDIPESWHEALREQMAEHGIDLAEWTPEQIAAACARAAEAAPEPDPFPYPNLLDLFLSDGR